MVLDRVMRQAGQDAGQELFRSLLLRLRNAELTVEDWKHLMTRTAGDVGDIRQFDTALHLYPTIEAVAEHNVAKLCASGHPVAVLRAVHTGPGASKPSCDIEMSESAALPSPLSIYLPPALPAKSQASDDIEILECSQPYVCPYKYHPVDDQWQRTTCAN